MANQGPALTPPLFLSSDGNYHKSRGEWLNTIKHIRFQVADGYAYYAVEDGGDTLRHIEIYDCYAVHPALIRGLTREEINLMLDQERHFAKMFGRV